METTENKVIELSGFLTFVRYLETFATATISIFDSITGLLMGLTFTIFFNMIVNGFTIVIMLKEKIHKMLGLQQDEVSIWVTISIGFVAAFAIAFATFIFSVYRDRKNKAEQIAENIKGIKIRKEVYILICASMLLSLAGWTMAFLPTMNLNERSFWEGFMSDSDNIFKMSVALCLAFLFDFIVLKFSQKIASTNAAEFAELGNQKLDIARKNVMDGMKRKKQSNVRQMSFDNDNFYNVSNL